MMPPISGMQAIAAATFEGKPVDVDFGPGTGPAIDGGGIRSSGGGMGASSGTTYIHKMADTLSSNSARRPIVRRTRCATLLFRFHSLGGTDIVAS